MRTPEYPRAPRPSERSVREVTVDGAVRSWIEFADGEGLEGGRIRRELVGPPAYESYRVTPPAVLPRETTLADLRRVLDRYGLRATSGL